MYENEEVCVSLFSVFFDVLSYEYFRSLNTNVKKGQKLKTEYFF